MTTTQLTVQDGLVGDNVYCAHQDTEGYIWFGTETGVSKYNGHGFQNYHLVDGLGDNEVFRIDEDSQGRIWFSGFNGQLSYYLNGNFHNPGNDSTLAKVNLESHYTNFFEDSRGTIWLTTQTEVVCLTLKGQVKVTNLIGGTEQYINTFKEKNGEVWGFSGRRKAEMKFWSEGKFVAIPSTVSEDQFLDTFDEYISKNPAHLTQFDFKVSTDYTLRLINNPDFQLPRISKLHSYRDDELWACTYAGAVLVDRVKGTARTFLSEYIVTHVLEDREGSYWITTLGSGVMYASSLNYKSISRYKDQKIGGIMSLQQDKGRITFGGGGGTFGKIEDGKAFVYKSKEQGRLLTKAIATGFKPNTFILAIESQLVERSHAKILRRAPFAAKMVLKWNGKYVIGNRETLLIVNERQLDKLFDMSFFEVRDARVLDGLSSLTEFVQKETGYIIDIEPFQDGLLVGTAEGLYYLSKSLDYQKISEHPLMDIRINDIAVLGDTYVLSTHGSGLLLKVAGEWVQFTEEDRLASNIVRKTVFQDDHLLWVATNGGVSRLKIDGDQVRVNSLNRNNGLNSEQVFDIVLGNQELILGTGEGISIVRSSDWEVEDIPPLLNVSMYSEDTEVALSDNITFDFGFPNLEIRYDGIHYRSHDELFYEYRLLGRNTNWIKTDQRSVNFGGLRPGDYTFEVRAISAFGTPSELSTIQFTVNAPFWLRWWFILALAAILTLLVTLVTNSFYKKKRLNEQKEFAVKLRIAEAERKALQSQLNPHFIFNSLNSVQSMVLKKEPQAAYDFLERFSKLIRRVLKLSEQSTIPLREELDTLKMYVELENERLKRKFEFNLSVEDQVDLGQEVPSLMIQPYVENAIWHGLMPLEGKRPGILDIKVFGRGDDLFIEIFDNGVGRQASIREGALGTKIARGLVDNFAVDRFGQVNIEDLKDGESPLGTKVTLHISLLESTYDKSLNY